MDIIAKEKEHGELIAGLPRPFAKVKIRTTGKAIAKEIDINLTSCKAIKERLFEARQSWRILRRRIPTCATLKNKTKLMLRNAIVRSTLTYGIQTLDLTGQDKQRMGGFAFYCLRQIHDIHWPQKPQKPQRKNMRAQMQQPATASWIWKLRLKHAFTQTRNICDIHSQQLPMITKTRQTWHEERREQKTNSHCYNIKGNNARTLKHGQKKQRKSRETNRTELKKV